MLILFLTFVVMGTINIAGADEPTKRNEVIESTMLTKVIQNIGKLFYGPEIEGVFISINLFKRNCFASSMLQFCVKK